MKPGLACFPCLLVAGLLCFSTVTAVARTGPNDRAAKAPLLRFQELAGRLATLPIDDCGDRWPPETEATAQKVHKLEDQLFDAAEVAVRASLNGKKLSPDLAVRAAFDRLEATSDREEGTKSPDERFQAQFLDLGTVLVVSFTLGNRAAFSAYGIPHTVLTPEGRPRKNTSWTRIGTDGFRRDAPIIREQLSIFPLWPGSSRAPRFLSAFREIACGDGQTVVPCDGYRWNASSVTGVEVIRQRRGVESGMDPGYPAIGELSFDGRRITLPYCWHSAVDDPIWAKLCSVDTYDLAGNRIRLVGTRTNRPDLLAVARAIQYAQPDDLRALTAYSGSAGVARRMAKEMPPESFFAAGVSVEQVGPEQETVELSDGGELKFTIVKKREGWVVLDFHASRN